MSRTYAAQSFIIDKPGDEVLWIIWQRRGYKDAQQEQDRREA